MLHFAIASLVSYLVLFISKVTINLYVIKYKDNEDALKTSLFFNTAAVFLLMSYGVFWVSITVLLSMIVNQRIL